MKKPRIIIVHGIHTNDDEAWMATLADEFTKHGWRAEVHTYGYAHALLTRWQNPGRADKLAWKVEPGDIVLGHSNGGCLAYMASYLGAPMGGAILLNPALDTHRVLAAHVPWVNLYPNRGDTAVRISSWFGLFDCLPAHPWGAQGRDGLSVNDERYHTIFTDDPHPRLPRVWGHSDILAPEKLKRWAPRIIEDAEVRLADQSTRQ